MSSISPATSAAGGSTEEIDDDRDRFTTNRTIQATHEIATNGPALSAPSQSALPLAGKHIVENRAALTPAIQSVARTITPPNTSAPADAVPVDPSETPPSNTSYIIKLRELVASLLALFQRISKKDRDTSEATKASYGKYTLETSDLQRVIGTRDFQFAMLSFAASLLQILPNQDDKAICRVVSDQLCPKLGEMVTSKKRGDMGRANNMSSLLLTDVQGAANEKGNKESSKSEFINALMEALRSTKEAARAG